MCTLIMYTLFIILNKGLFKDARKFALLINVLIMEILVVSYYIFDRSSNEEQWSFYHYSNHIGINQICIDSISLLFIILTVGLIVLCLITNWNLKYKIKEYVITLVVLEILLINLFSIFDLFLFYIFFESILIPMFLLIGIWGSRERKILAAYKFFIYTLIGSLFMLIAILNLYLHFGSSDIRLLNVSSLSHIRQILVAGCFLIGFAVKVPMFPVHLWLPEAHVEASTTGSMLLAGVLLKLGTYAVLRFLIPSFFTGLLFISPLVLLFAILSILYSSFATIRQIDLKKIVAYSSIAHMNFVIIGLFSFIFQGLEGAMIIMISHGVVSSALFFCIGLLYDRYKTRNILYYGGLAQLMPNFSSLFLIFILSNLSFPGSSGFVGEFLVLIGIFNTNILIAVLAAFTMVLSCAYSLWLYNRVVFGLLKSEILVNFADLTKREYFILVPLVFFTGLLGIFPFIFSNMLNFNILVLSYV